MRSVFYTPSGVQLMDVPEVKLQRPDDVKIKISYCGICGTDLHFVRKEMDHLLGPNKIAPLGHEATGVIAELGSAATVKGLKVGDKVVYYPNETCGKCHYCRNGQENFCLKRTSNARAMSDYIVVGEQVVFKLDDNVDLAKAIYIEPISVCLHALDLAQIKPGNRVAIFGGGGIGLITLHLAKLSGAVDLTLIEPVEMKRNIALQLGADYVFDPFVQDVVAEGMKLTENIGFDVVIETSCSAKACPDAYKLVGKGGTLEFVGGLYGADYNFPLNLEDAFFKEMKIIAGVLQSPYAIPRSIRLFKTLNIDPMLIENSIFEAEDCVNAFEAQLTGKTVKSIIKF